MACGTPLDFTQTVNGSAHPAGTNFNAPITTPGNESIIEVEPPNVRDKVNIFFGILKDVGWAVETLNETVDAEVEALPEDIWEVSQWRA